MKELVFDTFEEASKYSKEKYDGFNLFYDYNTRKLIRGSSSRRALLNPRIFVREPLANKTIKSSPKVNKPAKRIISSFDQL